MRTINLHGATPGLCAIAEIVKVLEEDGEVTVINGSKPPYGTANLYLGALMRDQLFNLKVEKQANGPAVYPEGKQ